MADRKSLTQLYYPETAFGGYSHVDGTVAFYSRVNSLLRPDSVVLDVGCGRGASADRLEEKPAEKIRVFKGRCAMVIGVDIDPAAQQNPFLDEFRLIEGDRWSVESGSIDLLVADYVLEHVEHPDAFFAECRRVTTPGGCVCFRTPNRWGYVAIGASIIPNRFHPRAVERLQSSRKEVDVFPTYYRANTAGKLRHHLAAYGFDGCVIRHEGEPGYLGFSRWTYAFGVYLHRWMPSILYSTLFVFGRRTTES